VPTLTQCPPPLAGLTPVYITGADFGLALGSVSLGSLACPLEVQDHSTIVCLTPTLSLTAGGGALPLTVGLTVAGQTALEMFTFTYDPPTASLITPSM